MNNFMIGPIGDGLRKDVKPYATPEDSFETLLNAYQFRGRVVRREGYKLLGRLANNTPVMGLRTQELFAVDQQALIAFDTTDAYLFNTGTSAFVPLPSVMPVTWNGTDSDFFYTINYAGAFWATNNVPGLHGWAIQDFTGASATTVVVTAAGNTVQLGDSVYLLNVTGGGAANNLIFGTVTLIGVPGSTFTITVNPNGFPTGITTFVNGTPATGVVLDTTQSVAGVDGIRYYGSTTAGTTWVNYNPPIDPNNALVGCLLMFSYRGYLVFLNTWEGNEGDIGDFPNYPNRARWTQIGTPYYTQPVPNVPNLQTADPLAARDDLFGRGGANDAPTSEAIVGAAFIRDILVVYFERSTWRLRFVNNSQNPFVWERVNVELGSDCTFSTIPFDKGLMAIGNRGIVMSDSNDTVRIDQKIPDDVFTIRQANNGFRRVFGIRTFRTKLNYWTFPSNLNPSGTYPDLVLVYNYDTGNWSFFDDCFTCFGYYYPSTVGPTWAELTEPWATYLSDGPNTGAQEVEVETIIAGNQQGFVFQLEIGNSTNDVSLYISAITGTTFTSPNNNLPDGTWIQLSGVVGTTSDDGVSLNGRNFKTSNPTLDADDFFLKEFEPINGGSALGSTYTFTIDFLPILPGSVQINVGALQFVDSSLNGNLFGSDGTSTGSINYTTGVLTLNFSAPIGSTTVYIRVVSNDPEQKLEIVNTTGAYTPNSGLITKISNIDIITKVFNFFGDDKRSRLSKIDFYTSATSNGQFTVNVYGDSSNEIINIPLPDNLQSNIVTTTPNPYQIGQGTEAINRLYCDAIAQTVQLEITLSDQQMAVTQINNQDVEILAMMISMRRGGRLV